MNISMITQKQIHFILVKAQQKQLMSFVQFYWQQGLADSVYPGERSTETVNESCPILLPTGLSRFCLTW